MAEDHHDDFGARTLANVRSARTESYALKILLIVSTDPGGRAEVLSMRRALRMLGHKIFTISASRHPGLIREAEPTGGSAKTLRLKGVTKILHTFKPDVVLVANMPLAFDRESRTWAAEVGVPLILLETQRGSQITEKVFNSYDFHAGEMVQVGARLSRIPFQLAVDASLAVSYRVSNRSGTLAFGIYDPQRIRTEFPAFFAETVDDPAFRGAQAGPEEVDARYIEQALVHIYAPVSGSRRQRSWQILRSLYSGAIVVAPQSLKLPVHITELSSVYEYASESQLQAIVEQLKRGNSDTQVKASANVSQLSSNALLEDQFIEMFASIRALAEGDAGISTSVRRRIIHRWRPPSSGPDDQQVVAISGWYGERNLGDELILQTLIQGLGRVNPEGQVVVAAPRPARVEQDHGVASVPRHEMKALAQLANYADCLVVGGGGIWNDKSVAKNGGLAGLFEAPKHSVVNLAALPVLFSAVGKPVAGLGLGVGPLKEPSGRSLVRLMASLSTILSVRDRRSDALLSSLVDPAKQRSVDGDLAFAWDIPGRTPRMVSETDRRRPVIGVNVRVPEGQNSDEKNAGWPGLADALASLSNRYNCEFVGLPFHNDDYDELFRLFEACGDVAWTVLPFTTDAAQVAADLGSCDLVVAMRLHASILSHRMDVVSVGLNYEDKIEDYYHEVGEEERLVSIDDSQASLEGLLSAAFLNRSVTLVRQREVIGRLELEAKEKLDANLRGLLKQSRNQSIDFWSL